MECDIHTNLLSHLWCVFTPIFLVYISHLHLQNFNNMGTLMTQLMYHLMVNDIILEDGSQINDQH